MNETAGTYLLLNCECNNDTMVVSYSPKTLEYFICCAQCGAHLTTIPSYAFNYAIDKPVKCEANEDGDMDEDGDWDSEEEDEDMDEDGDLDSDEVKYACRDEVKYACREEEV